MLIKIGGFEFTEVWDGVLYKNLSDYPNISDWEKRTLIEFVEYEKHHGRTCTLECEHDILRARIESALQNPDAYRNTPRPPLLTECTVCPVRKGCVTDFVCHTTSPENAEKIFVSGSLLSALRARKVPVEELMAESRNAAGDPADYFEYIMLSWGNCQAGDRLVMERKLNRFPDERDLSDHFTPGVRFYFRYEDLVNHPSRIFDGALPMKIKDELILKDWLYAVVIPTYLKPRLDAKIPDDLRSRVLYIENDCKDIWEWSEKVYQTVERKRTKHQVQQDLDNLPQPYKTADVDRLIRRYGKQNADVSELRPHILTEQQFHRIYYYVNLNRIKTAEERMAFIHENLLFSDWWHTDQIISYVADLDFDMALQYAQRYIRSEDPFIRRWGYVLFISRLCKGHALQLLPLMHDDEEYYVQMAEAWLIAELAVHEPEAVHHWLSQNGLKYSINGKAIQKICDSFRISDEWKGLFRELRPQLRLRK